MSKKVGIITFHAAHNYGAMLQAYALQQTIISLGYDCEIIDFRTPAQEALYTPDFLKGPIEKRFKSLINNLTKIGKILDKAHRFEKFMTEALILSPRSYSSIQDLGQANLSYDIYVSGSDQIWNPALPDASDAYMLGFTSSGRKVAYAASMGGTINPDSAKQIISNLPLLEQYSAISVREDIAKDFLSEHGVESTITLDPTLLLDREKWDAIAGDKPIVEGEYIFAFSPLEHDNILYEYANKLSEQTGLKTIITTPFLYRSDKKTWPNLTEHIAVGPKEFLNLVKHAKFVCSKSFHCTVFSILFNKPFVAVGLKHDQRLNTILRLTGNAERSIDADNFDIDLAKSPDSDFASLNDKIDQSVTFLRNNLSNKG